MTNENKIRDAAYYVWLSNGCPENAEIDCWLEAETVHCECDGNTCVCIACKCNPCECDPCECGDECGCCADKEKEKKPAPKKAVKATEKKAPAKKVAKK